MDFMLRYPEEPDQLSATRPGAREAILCGPTIQPHGILFVLDSKDQKISQVSRNVSDLFGRDPKEVIGKPLENVIGAPAAESIMHQLASARELSRPMLLSRLEIKAGEESREFTPIVHHSAAGIVLELECSGLGGVAADPVIYPIIDTYTLQAEAISRFEELCEYTAAEIRRVTGFDRVLIYRFDKNWNGETIGESLSGRLSSYLNHYFPSSSFPAQARELCRLNRTHLVPDVNYKPIPFETEAQAEPIDMSFCALRGAPQLNLTYMRKMQTRAFMSVSILRGGRLWGLVVCHHKEPLYVPYPARLACDLIARAFSLRLAAVEQAQEVHKQLRIKAANARLLAAMTGACDIEAGLSGESECLIEMAGAEGAAIVFDGRCVLIGKTPAESEVAELSNWLFEVEKSEIFQTSRLPEVYPKGESFKAQACGIMSIAISKIHPSFLIWFRPEMVQTINWGGDPYKLSSIKKNDQTRDLFESYEQTVRGTSMEWDKAETEGAAELRNMIIGSVLKRAEEMSELNAELRRSNKELEAFSYSVSHDLRAPLRHIVGYAELLKEKLANGLSERELNHLNSIIDSSEYAGRLVEKLLGYSRLGRAELQIIPIDMNILLSEIKNEAMQDAGQRQIEWRIYKLPEVEADLMMLRMAVKDLFSNAVKYTKNKEKALIEAGCKEEEHEYLFWVKDNGAGFNMQYADKLFGVFQRLHRWEEYEGTGIGLANVRRVIERHGGRTWAKGAEGAGATFYFTLPKHIGGNRRL